MQIRHLVVHCSDSPQDRGDDAAVIHRWHKARSWDGIGYHYVILEDGTVQAGRPEYWVGAHVRNNNSTSLGICLIGIDDFTEEQYASLAHLLSDLKQVHTVAVVCGHRDLDPNKDCPNFDVKPWWEATKNL